jgi:microcystin degradation protein MlrC
MRIAIAGLSHEALNFSPITTSMQDFQVWRGEEILAADSRLTPYPPVRLTPCPPGPAKICFLA